MKIQLLKDKNLHGARFKLGDVVIVPDKVGERWASRGIAIQIMDPPEPKPEPKPKPKDIKKDKPKRSKSGRVKKI